MAEKQTAKPEAAPRRALRADARRNRERVLSAARDAFAAEGITVPLDDIARRAGVGPGTVYRHFPTKEALFQAAIVDNIERMTDYARGLDNADDPGVAFFELLDHIVDQGKVKRDLADAMGGHQTVEITGPTKEFQALTARIMTRAQEFGAVRTDIDIDDLFRLLKGTLSVTHTATDEQRARAFAVVGDGLRPPD